MLSSRYVSSLFFAVLILCLLASGQQAPAHAAQAGPQEPQQDRKLATTSVPRLVEYSGRASDMNGKPIAGLAGVTFAIFREQFAGAPLWLETQNVMADGKGNYSAQLGATKPAGLPIDLFGSGEARWLGIRVNGGQEQPRVLLLSVPYALKAADAETVGGLPASAFALATPISALGTLSSSSSPSDPASNPQAPPPTAVSGAGTANFVPLWTGASTMGNSVVFQSGTGDTAKVGINTTTPGVTLEVKGATTIRGVLALPAPAAATTAAGKASQPLNLTASAFNSGTKAAVGQTFRWQAEPAANNTTAPTATLNLLYGLGASAPAETGLKIAHDGKITFAPGQTFPGGTGSVSSVALSAPAADFTVAGSPVTTTGTLSMNWKVAPTSASKANAIVKRDASGGFSAGALTVTPSSVSIVAAGSTKRFDLGNDGTMAITSDPGDDSTADLVGYNLIERGVGGAPSKWSIYTAAVGGGFGVPANAFSIYEYPPNQDPGCCLQRFVILPSLSGQDVATAVLDGGGRLSLGGGDYSGRLHAVAGGDYSAVHGECPTFNVFGCRGIFGESYGQTGVGVDGRANGDLGVGVEGVGIGGASNALAGYFVGNVQIDGTIAYGSSSLKIDHPLDPANRYLSHSAVESPDMKNVYDGMATLDGKGEAVVDLPEWFEALNRDFRYQLTPIGAPGPNLYIAQEITGNRFNIAGGRPGGKVSWQVTGIRQDAWANAHRMPVEQEKPERERGFYLHPELFGAPPEKSVASARHPEIMNRPKK